MSGILRQKAPINDSLYPGGKELQEIDTAHLDALQVVSEAAIFGVKFSERAQCTWST